MKVNSSTPRIRVVKVGGSLCDIPDLRRRLLSWLEDRREFSVLIAGGGESVDEILLSARQQGLSERQTHWLAIERMSATAHRLGDLLSPCTIVATLSELTESAANDRFCVFDCETLLMEDAGRTLPESNDISSDSIAAWLAHRLCTGVTLLKSQGGDEPFSTQRAAELGWVDPCFPNVAKDLDVEWINFRQDRVCRLVPTKHPAG